MNLCQQVGWSSVSHTTLLRKVVVGVDDDSFTNFHSPRRCTIDERMLPGEDWPVKLGCELTEAEKEAEYEQRGGVGGLSVSAHFFDKFPLFYSFSPATVAARFGLSVWICRL